MLDSESQYEMFKLLNMEFSFTVDVSQMPCGLNGALYFVEMSQNGDQSSTNKAGAKYGTGYCDAQCPHDIKWIDGGGNVIDWNPSPNDPNAGIGKWGTCCAEMDIWEANSISSAYTVHGCTTEGQHKCVDTECGDSSKGERYKGVCDKDGCDLNPYRVGVTDFFGPGSQFSVDTTKPFQIVTQFLTADNTTTGTLSEIRRVFVQNDKVIPHPMSKVDKLDKQHDSLSDEFCKAIKPAFEDTDDFTPKGGMDTMGKAMGRGMVLVMSLWDDHEANMLWLDSTDPPTKTEQGGPRGTCATTSGVPADVEREHGDAHVKFSDIKVGEIGSTFHGNTPTPPTPGTCPGGSLSACIADCPSTPSKAYQACVKECVARCTGEDEPAFLQ